MNFGRRHILASCYDFRFYRETYSCLKYSLKLNSSVKVRWSMYLVGSVSLHYGKIMHFRIELTKLAKMFFEPIEILCLMGPLQIALSVLLFIKQERVCLLKDLLVVVLSLIKC